MKQKYIFLSILLPVFLIGCSTQGNTSSQLNSSSQYTSSGIESSSFSSSSEVSSSKESSSSSQRSSSREDSSSQAQSSSSQSNSTSESSVSNYVLFGLFKGYGNWTEKAMSVNPSDSSEYYIQGVSLNSGDLLKIHMYGDTWYGYSALKSSVPSGLVTRGSSDDNIKVVATGTYDIYSSYNESDGGHIYLDRTDGPETINVTGISLDRTGKFMQMRNEYTLTATIYPENATNKEIVWSSSDTSIATVKTSGRVVAGSKTGTTIITAKTVDGNKVAECRIYVSASQYPDYFLTGTINGRSYSYGQFTYAALPLETSGRYLIPDVELSKGDELTVTGDNGATLKNKSNQTYKYSVSKKMSVNIYLNVKDENKNYLTLVEK